MGPFFTALFKKKPLIPTCSGSKRSLCTASFIVHFLPLQLPCLSLLFPVKPLLQQFSTKIQEFNSGTKKMKRNRMKEILSFLNRHRLKAGKDKELKQISTIFNDSVKILSRYSLNTHI